MRTNKQNPLIRSGAAGCFAALLVLFVFLLPACKKTSAPSVDTVDVVPKASPFSAPSATPVELPYALVTVSSAEASDGLFALINHSHAYSHTDAVASRVLPLNDGKSKHLLLVQKDAALDGAAANALNAFSDGFFTETGGDRLLVTGAFRTIEYQKGVYDEYVKTHGEETARLYVADPGCSEHHTGLAVDLSTMSAEGLRVPLLEHESFEWVKRQCAEYGFILRYPVGSESITRVAYEPWHFRYLGRGSALAVNALGMVYDEYIEHIRRYSIESGMLHVLPKGGGEAALDVVGLDRLPTSGFLIYSVPAELGSTTSIPLPKGIDAYTVSGDNAGCFIVCAELGEAEGNN